MNSAVSKSTQWIIKIPVFINIRNMPVIFQAECGPKCRSKHHSLEVNSVVTKGSLLDLQAYSRLCFTWAQHTDTAGRSALHLAASCGKTDMVEWLVTEKHQESSLKDKESGWTALHRALFYGQLAAARLLIQYNNDLYCRDHEGLGPLDMLLKDRPQQICFDVKDQNEVYSWGDNSNLTLGHASEQHRTIPEAVDSFRRLGVSVKQVVMCKYHTVFLAQGGQVYTCGHGQGGRLGHGDEITCVTPRLVEALQKEECTQVAAARDHTLFLTDKNIVYGCGLNDCSQLGLTSTGDKATNKCLIPAKMNLKLLKGKQIMGICAGRFHSVVYTVDGVYTCGLNAGQIGQPKGEQHQTQLRLVSSLNHKDIVITKVVSSDAAIVCISARGDIFLFYEYASRKIGSRWQEIQKVCVCGGNLDHNTDLDVLREKGGFELRVILLNNTGKVFIWRSTSPSLKRCLFAIRRQIMVTDIVVNTTGLLLVTDQGEAFTGYPSGRKSANVQKDAGKENNKDADFGKMSLMDLMVKDEVEEISLRRVPMVHRAVKLACDMKGGNFAVLQALPNGWMTDVPTVSESQIHTEYEQLMEEADLFDAIHDCVVQVGDHRWPAHMFILATRADYFRKQVPCLVPELDNCSEKPVVDIADVEPDVMEQLLKFIYTNTCDLLTIGSKHTFAHLERQGDNSGMVSNYGKEGGGLMFDGRSVSAFEVAQHEKKMNAGQKEGGKGGNKGKDRRDPVKTLQEAARRFGVKGLSKRLESVKRVNGVIQATGKKLPYRHIKYDRTKLPELYDVRIRADNDVAIQCHKCVLAARLEYFHSMLGSGWIETSDTESLTLPIPGDILEILLDFVYQDDSLIVKETQDLELLCNVLVVADQLLVQRLKEMCEVALTSQVTLRNVGELLEIASAYNASQLSQACHQYITLNLPALLESRNLDMLGEDTMQELTDYYKSSVGGMSCRVITPWSDGPDADYLAALTADFNFDPSTASRPRDSAGKKPKAKRRQGHTKSVSEEGAPPGGGGSKQGSAKRERKVSVCSDVSIKSEEDMEDEEDPVVEVKPEPNTPSGNAATQKSAKSSRWLPFNLAASPQQNDTSRQHQPRSTTPTHPPLPSPQLQSPVSPTWGSRPRLQSPISPVTPFAGPASPTSGTGGVSLRNIMQEQQDPATSTRPKSGGRFSWKEAKKQQKEAAQVQKAAASQQASAATPSSSLPATSPPPCPWGGAVSKVIPSFRDLMLQDKTTPQHPVDLVTSPPSQTKHSPAQLGKSSPSSAPKNCSAKHGTTAVGTRSTCGSVSKNAQQSASGFSWGLPVRIPSQPQAIPTTSPTPSEPQPSPSPSDNPWLRMMASSPPGGATASVSFSDIVQDQMHQKRSLEKATQKPLHLIQMEEEAISQLLNHYRAHQRSDEYITVERVSGPMATPLWNRKRTTSSSHT